VNFNAARRCDNGTDQGFIEDSNANTERHSKTDGGFDPSNNPLLQRQ
jgi:hypothetical protein